MSHKWLQFRRCRDKLLVFRFARLSLWSALMTALGCYRSSPRDSRGSAPLAQPRRPAGLHAEQGAPAQTPLEDCGRRQVDPAPLTVILTLWMPTLSVFFLLHGS